MWTDWYGLNVAVFLDLSLNTRGYDGNLHYVVLRTGPEAVHYGRTLYKKTKQSDQFYELKKLKKHKITHRLEMAVQNYQG